MEYSFTMAKPPSTALVMHPVVCDELIRDDHMQRLRNVTNLIAEEPFRKVTDLAESMQQVEVLVTSWGCPRIDSVIIDQLPRLKLIAHMAGSVKGFLDDVVWRRGILVTNAVAANAVPVAEYTLAAILFANKKVFQLNRFYLKNHENRAPWTKEAPNVGNYRKTVGIVGASQVGQLVISLLQQFDIRALLYDPFVTPLAARDMGATKVGLSELLSGSDVVTLHAPLLHDTHHMIGARELSLMRDGATLINTARGGLVDQTALAEELAKDRLFAVLDTTDPEVLPASSPFYRASNVFLTPHIAGSLGDETQRLTDFIISEIEKFTRGNAMRYLVRREHLARLA